MIILKLVSLYTKKFLLLCATLELRKYIEANCVKMVFENEQINSINYSKDIHNIGHIPPLSPLNILHVQSIRTL